MMQSDVGSMQKRDFVLEQLVKPEEWRNRLWVDFILNTEYYGLEEQSKKRNTVSALLKAKYQGEVLEVLERYLEVLKDMPALLFEVITCNWERKKKKKKQTELQGLQSKIFVVDPWRI